MGWTKPNPRLSTLQSLPPTNILSMTDKYLFTPGPIYICLKYCYLSYEPSEIKYHFQIRLSRQNINPS